MSTISALEKLKTKKAQLEARIQAMEARNKSKERKIDTRKKILIGSYYLNQATKESKLDELTKIMDKFLERDNDRQLFGLAPKTKKSK
jgi:hypothetical protein